MNIRPLLLSLGLVASILPVSSQTPNPNKCGTMEHMEYMMSQDPGLRQRMVQDEELLQQQMQHDAVSRNSNAVYTIPVVVHVVYRTPTQNISDAQILSQIAVLNEDFGRTNADTNNTPAAFRSVAS